MRFSDPFFSAFVTGVSTKRPSAAEPLVSANLEDDNEIATYLRQIRSRRSDGFIVMRTQRQDSRIDLLRAGCALCRLWPRRG